MQPCVNCIVYLIKPAPGIFAFAGLCTVVRAFLFLLYSPLSPSFYWYCAWSDLVLRQLTEKPLLVALPGAAEPVQSLSVLLNDEEVFSFQLF